MSVIRLDDLKRDEEDGRHDRERCDTAKKDLEACARKGRCSGQQGGRHRIWEPRVAGGSHLGGSAECDERCSLLLGLERCSRREREVAFLGQLVEFLMIRGGGLAEGREVGEGIAEVSGRS